MRFQHSVELPISMIICSPVSYNSVWSQNRRLLYHRFTSLHHIGYHDRACYLCNGQLSSGVCLCVHVREGMRMDSERLLLPFAPCSWWVASGWVNVSERAVWEFWLLLFCFLLLVLAWVGVQAVGMMWCFDANCSFHFSLLFLLLFSSFFCFCVFSSH